MKNKLFTLVAFVAIACTTATAQKVGYLDTDTLLTMMPEVKKADSILARYRDDIQKVYSMKVMEYQQKLTEYQNNFEAWGEVMREAAEEELGNLQLGISDYEQQSTDKLQRKKQELYDPILNKVKGAIKQVGDENKFTAIFDKAGMLYVGTDAIDILPMVKKKLGLL